jgi:hypothetical protein
MFVLFRTVMVATISPAADSYEETLSTLRYADRKEQQTNHINNHKYPHLIGQQQLASFQLARSVAYGPNTAPFSILAFHWFLS